MLDKILSFLASFLKTKTYTVSTGDEGTVSTADSICTRMGNVVSVTVRVTDLPTGQTASQIVAKIPSEAAPSKTLYFPYGAQGQSAWQSSQYAYINTSGNIVLTAAQINAVGQIFMNFSYVL